MASFIRYVWTQWMRTEAASFARGPARRSGGISESSKAALDPRGRTAADVEV